MKKAIRILSVIAAAIMVLTAVLFLGVVLLQGVLGPMIFNYPEMVREHFAFPAGQAVYIFGITAVTVLLATTGGAERIGCLAYPFGKLLQALFELCLFRFKSYTLLTERGNLGLSCQQTRITLGASSRKCTARIDNLTVKRNYLYTVIKLFSRIGCIINIIENKCTKKQQLDYGLKLCLDINERIRTTNVSRKGLRTADLIGLG
jgi:hypothetical protein